MKTEIKREGVSERDREKRKEHKHKLITLIFLTSVAPTRSSHFLLNCDTHIFSACSHLRTTTTYRDRENSSCICAKRTTHVTFLSFFDNCSMTS